MKKILLIIFMFIFFVLGFVGIMMENKKEEKVLKKVTVAEVTHSVFYVPWYVSLSKGYFEEEGLDIDVVLTPGADKTAAAVLSNDVNIGFSGPEVTLYIYNNGEEDNLLTFAALTKRDGQFLLGPCEYKKDFSISMLKGKTVLAGRSAGMPLMIFNYALKESGLTKDDVNIDDSVDFASLSGAFISKQGEFVNLFEPTASKIEKEGYGCVLSSLGLLSGEVPYTAFYARKSFIEKNKDVIKSFIRAINKGLKYTKENNSETLAKDIINEFPDTKIEDLINIIERYKNADSWWDSSLVSISAFERLEDIMIYNNAIDKKIDLDKVIINF